MTFAPEAGHIFRGNEWLTPAGVGFRDVVNPADLTIAGRIALATPALAEEVAREALAAQRSWKRVDAKTRAKALHDIADSIARADMHDVARLMVLEMGKPYPEAVGELLNVAPAFRYFAEMARDEAGKVAGTTQAGSFQFARYEPYGVSVHIMPFNFPILLMCWTV
ncbi:MAG: aldehyde dehydrogenase family protein, partial [Rhizobiaceae bacterium]